MIIFPEQYVPLYEAVKADAYASDDRKVVVFVSAGEADSVCAVRILQVREREREEGGGVGGQAGEGGPAGRRHFARVARDFRLLARRRSLSLRTARVRGEPTQRPSERGTKNGAPTAAPPLPLPSSLRCSSRPTTSPSPSSPSPPGPRFGRCARHSWWTTG